MAVLCSTCRGKGEIPAPGTHGPTVSPENLELLPCPVCKGAGEAPSR